jgi:hypothetical protein
MVVQISPDEFLDINIVHPTWLVHGWLTLDMHFKDYGGANYS